MNNDHTFVICAYGESVFLEDCIQSLMKQNLQSNIICYTSTPNEYIKTLCEKYRISLYTKVGGGIGKDWNNALSFVKTKYVTIAHQDDIYLPNYALQIVNKFNTYPNSTIVYTDYAELRDKGVVLENTNLVIKTMMLKVLNLFPNSSFWQRRILAFGNPIACPAVSYNLELLDNFRFNENLRTSLDWFAWYTISNNYQGRFTYIKEKEMYHRIHDDSETTATISDNTRTNEDFMMFKLMWPKWIASVLIFFYQKSQKSND